MMMHPNVVAKQAHSCWCHCSEPALLCSHVPPLNTSARTPTCTTMQPQQWPVCSMYEAATCGCTAPAQLGLCQLEVELVDILLIEVDSL